MAMNQRTRAASESIGLLAIIAGILIALNVLSVFFFARLDLTEAKLFSLSDGSKRVARSLDDKMEVIAYFTEDLPPPFNATERYVRDMLEEYVAASNGKITFRVVHPDTDDEKQEAERDGVPRVQYRKFGSDSVQFQEGYGGIAFKYLGETKSIQFVQDTSGLEYNITQIIKQMSGEKRPIGILTGHEMPQLAQNLTALREQLPMYELREVPATEAIPRDLAALLIIGPQDALTEAELRNIDAYVMSGGSLGVFGGGLKIGLEGMPTAEPVDTGLNRLLNRWGVRIKQNILGDFQCEHAPMRGPLGLTVAVPYPPRPTITFDEAQREHPVLFRLNQVPLIWTSGLEATSAVRNDRQVEVTTLAKTSENSWVIQTEGSLTLQPRDPREWPMSQSTGPFPVMMAIEGRLPSAFAGGAVSTEDGQQPAAGPERATKKVRVLVVGSSTFLRDELQPPAGPDGQRQLNEAISFALNAVDWLAQESDLIAIRAKSVEDPKLEVPTGLREAEEEALEAAQGQDQDAVDEALEKRKQALAAWDGKKAGYRWVNMLGLPVLFAVFGVVRWRMRKAKRASIKL